MNDVKLGKTISYALRHHPEEFGLELDDEGWVDVDKLLLALEQQWGKLTLDDIYDVMNHSDKKRYEIKGEKIRAFYGHSFQKKIKKNPVKPPQFLYHGTARRFVDSIMKDGLLPMQRQYVHLSEDIETATRVGGRHDAHPVILKINAQQAYNDGVLFYEANDQVWLSEIIIPQYIEKMNENNHKKTIL